MKISPKEKAEQIYKKFGLVSLSLDCIEEVLEATKRKITVKGKESYAYHPYYLEVKAELEKM